MAERIFDSYTTSPQRMEHIKRKNEQASSGKPRDCVFCAVKNSGEFGNLKTPSTIDVLDGDLHIIAKFEKSMAIANKYPYGLMGHVMIVPYRHVIDIDKLTGEEVDEIFKGIVPRLMDAMRKEYKAVTGFNVGINIGQSAGASIDHLHVHIVPRFPSENGFMETTAGTRVSAETPEITMERLGKHFQ